MEPEAERKWVCFKLIARNHLATKRFAPAECPHLIPINNAFLQPCCPLSLYTYLFAILLSSPSLHIYSGSRLPILFGQRLTNICPGRHAPSLSPSRIPSQYAVCLLLQLGLHKPGPARFFLTSQPCDRCKRKWACVLLRLQIGIRQVGCAKNGDTD